MPPKKGTGESAVVAILKETGVHNAKQITDSTLRKIYKLEDDVPAPQDANSSTGGIDRFLTRPPIHNFKACDNAWNTPEKRKEALAREAAKASKSGQNKKKLRAVRSESEDGHHILDPSCTLANCRDNPRCVNWLGQHLWEDGKLDCSPNTVV